MQDGRVPQTHRAASGSIVRWGVLIGGLVIIVDLCALAVSQRTATPDDLMAIAGVDELVNFVLFAILGVVVVRDTGLIYMGAITGVFAALLDAVVVAAANTMAPPPGPTQPIEEYIVSNLALGTLFAGASGIVYALIQRWSGNRRQK
jgi:hypothetical protein